MGEEGGGTRNKRDLTKLPVRVKRGRETGNVMGDWFRLQSRDDFFPNVTIHIKPQYMIAFDAGNLVHYFYTWPGSSYF